MLTHSLPSGGSIPLEVELQVVARADYCCEYCGSGDATEFHLSTHPAWACSAADVFLSCKSCLAKLQLSGTTTGKYND